LKTHLFCTGFCAVVGEEDVDVNIKTQPYTVGSLEVPACFVPEIDKAVKGVASLACQIDTNAYKHLTVFIDPIDGTREFSTGLGEQCTILIGFAEKSKSAAGLIYRPLTVPVTWASGCSAESHFEGAFDRTSPNTKGFLTTNGRISKFTTELIREMGYEQVKSGGAGNKLMMLIEGKGACYIQDRGLSRWDTCAPEAVIEAQGGALSKLSTFISGNSLSSYKYAKTVHNLDFEPGAARLTPYNAADRSKVMKSDSVLATKVEQFKPYSNTCGLLALTAAGLSDRKSLFASMVKAAKTSPPAFD